MIQPLRTVHRRAFVALAFVLPAILLAGLGARRPHAQPVLSTQLPDSLHLLGESSNLWQKHALTTAFYRDSGRRADIDVVLTPVQEWNEPDLLLYWSGVPPQGESLPAEAQLLGSFVAHQRFTLPSNSAPGYLLLFSLAHERVFDTARLEKVR